MADGMWFFDRMPCSACTGCKHFSIVKSDASMNSRPYKCSATGSAPSEPREPPKYCAYCNKVISSRQYFWTGKALDDLNIMLGEERAAAQQRQSEDALYCSPRCMKADVAELGSSLARKRSAVRDSENQQTLAEVSRRIGYQADWDDLVNDFCPLSASSNGYLHVSELRREVTTVYNAFINAGIALPPLEKTISGLASFFWNWDFPASCWVLNVDHTWYGINDIAALKEKLKKRACFAAPEEDLSENMQCATEVSNDHNYIYYNRDELKLFA